MRHGNPKNRIILPVLGLWLLYLILWVEVHLVCRYGWSKYTKLYTVNFYYFWIYFVFNWDIKEWCGKTKHNLFCFDLCLQLFYWNLLFCSSTFLSICKQRPSKKTNETFWLDGKAFSKWSDTVFWNYTQIQVTHFTKRSNELHLKKKKKVNTVEKLLLLFCILLMYCGLYVAECGSSKQRQWLWGLCVTGKCFSCSLSTSNYNARNVCLSVCRCTINLTEYPRKCNFNCVLVWKTQN